MITEERKAQLRKAKRKYRFKEMLFKKIDRGARFSYKPDVLIDGYMSQDERNRLSGKAFLNMYCSEDAPDTQEEKSFNIPLDTTQEELVALLARFFNRRDVHPNGIKRTIKWLLHALHIKPTLEDLSAGISETLEEKRPSTSSAANAILDGLRSYGRCSDSDILNILDRIADKVNNPS